MIPPCAIQQLQQAVLPWSITYELRSAVYAVVSVVDPDLDESAVSDAGMSIVANCASSSSLMLVKSLERVPQILQKVGIAWPDRFWTAWHAANRICIMAAILNLANDSTPDASS